MKFEEALSLMREGRQVTRLKWWKEDISKHISFMPNLFTGEVTIMEAMNGKRSAWKPVLEDIVACDWDLY